MKIVPTLGGVENVQCIQGGEWHGNWQRRMCDNIINHSKSITQCMRQAGKGYTLTECCNAALLGGLIVTIAMPTLTQSQRILFRSIVNGMAKLERKSGGKLRRIRDTETEVLWSNGAELRALSSNEASQKEGYTSDWVVIDEAHNADPSILKIFQPFTNQAKRYGRAKLVINGIGGHPASLIESAKSMTGWSSLRITPDEVAQDNPTYIPIIEDARETLSPEEFRQHYECLPVLEGSRYIFPIVNDAQPLPDCGITSTYYFGIDVGRIHDATFVSVIETRGGIANIVDEDSFTGCDFYEQAQRIFKFIDKYQYRPGNVAIEVNGMGYGLYDVLHNGPLYGLIPVTSTDKLIVSVIFKLQDLMRKKRLGISAPKLYKEFAEITYEVKDTGRYAFQHSDPLSSVITGFTIASQAVAA